MKPDTPARDPRRVLIVSAEMGEGHNATGRALAGAVRRLWPGAEVVWTDVLDAMGTGPLFRAVYVGSVNRLPWLYEYFYGSVWRHRWFARAAKRFIGSWAGRRLAPVLDRETPDLVLSTYPMGSTGLEWLRRHRGLAVPVGAWISDFAPHPSWVHTGVDRNFVMHDVALRPAREAVPGAAVAVSAPPVPEMFRPGDRSSARRRAGLPARGQVYLLSCGSLAFGDAAGTVADLLEGDPDAVVVVVTGRNERQREALHRRFHADRRVRVLGWVADMAELMTASDVVVTNAGGATALEALACGRAIVLYRPIAGHGKANAGLMAAARLAQDCADAAELHDLQRRLRRDPSVQAGMEDAAARHLTGRRLEDGLRELAEVPAGEHPVVLRASDALFANAETEAESQYLGTVLVVDEAPDLDTDRVAHLLSGIPGVWGRVRPGHGFRCAGWVPHPRTDPGRIIDEVDLGGGDHQAMTAAADRFFGEAWPEPGTCAAARIVRGLPGGRAALLVKVHHALGDGMTMLRGLLSEVDGAGGFAWSSALRHSAWQAAESGGPRLGGLVRLALGSRAPVVPWRDAAAGRERTHAFLDLPGGQVRRAAREHGVAPGELIHALVAEGLHRTRRPPAGSRFRVVVPWSLRGTTTLRAPGNRTGAMPIDLPVGPMPPRERVAAVSARLRAQRAAGVPEAAARVVRLLGALPPGLGARAARQLYRGRWFGGIGTVLPGPRRRVTWRNHPVVTAYPVLALAPGTALAWGALTWGDSITLGFTGRSDPAALADAVEAALADLGTAR